MKILGIDNGLDGGLVLLNGHDPVERIVMPTINMGGGNTTGSGGSPAERRTI